MDLRNLCSKLDVDGIRAKIPPLPQIKLPKSMPKLKSRKIFRSSRENVNSASRSVSSKRKTSNSENLALPSGPSSDIINRTPNRISTISSLMNQRENDDRVLSKWKSKNYDDNDDDENFYRSAGGIEDYYPSPLNQRLEQRMSRPISPVKAPLNTQELRTQSEQNIKMSFGEKLQKGYKDVTEFKLKHLFAKRTVVRTDKIEVTEYIHRFDEDRLQEERVQQKIDRDIADNYRFHFKVSQQKSEESCINSPASSTPQNNELKKYQKTVSELSGDESGMESSPPSRKPGIASTRFARVRQDPLSMSLDEDNDDDDQIHVVEGESSKTMPEKLSNSQRSSQRSCKLLEIHHSSLNSSMEDQDDAENDEVNDEIELNIVEEITPKIQSNSSTLYNIKKHQIPDSSSSRKTKSIKERMSRFTKQKSEGDEKKRRAPLSPQQSEENEATTKSDKPFEAIKQNFKRLQKSIKLPQEAPTQAGSASGNDEPNIGNKTILTKTQQFGERIKRFRSTDQVNKNPEEDDKEMPIHKISNKLQEWKKSFKKKVDLHNTGNEDDYEASSPQKPIGSFIKKIKNIKSRKHDSTDDPDDDEEGGETYKESLAARAKLHLEKGVVVASLVPQKTMKKLSDTKRYFRKRQDIDDDKNKTDKSKSDEEEEEENEQAKIASKPVAKYIPRPPPPIPRPYLNDSSDEEDSAGRQAFITKSIAESQLIAMPAARAVWTTKPILSDDTTDYDDELPRVLLHQDNSDIFESTLIIAVTRPISRTTTPIITELPQDSTEESTPCTKQNNWIPNPDMLDNWTPAQDMTPPSQRETSKDSNETSSSKGHHRKHSIDTSSEDSWIKDIPRGPSVAVINSEYENEKPWKTQKRNPTDNLYKTKSIDLFEMQKKHGGVLTAFEDFDDELKNSPIVKIENDGLQNNQIRRNADNYERESSEELENPDDDNSSRVTKISVHPPELKYIANEQNKPELKSQPYSNSQESLAENLENKNAADNGAEDDNDNGEKDKIERIENKIEYDQPPSKTPSPPPTISPTPQPLAETQPSVKLTKVSQSSLDLNCPSEPPPPLPLTRPPIPPNRPTPTPTPPKIPDRNNTATRYSKPLVKTASLRLAYSEQVNPEDVGKVNKLISRFEPEGPKQKPRIVPRKPWISNESEEYSDEEDSFELLPTQQREKTKYTTTTPTNHPKIQKSFSIDSVDLPNNNDQLSTPTTTKLQKTISRHATSQIILDNSESAMLIPSISISSSCLDINSNSNFSQPSSVYGSPLPYPSSFIGSTEIAPLTNRKESEYLGMRRNRRSMARDDEHFYSFDSDDENSYYSISSTSSNRYVVDL